MTVPLISMSALFIQGLRVKDLVHYLLFMQKYSTSDLVVYFYKHFTGFFYSNAMLFADLKIFSGFFLNFILAALVFYLFFLVASNKFINKIKIRIPLIVSVFVFIVLLVFLKKFIIDNSTDYSFCWIPISTALILIFSMVRFFISMKKSQLITLDEKIFIFLTFIGLTATLKSFFFINFRVFGTFMIPLALLVNVIFLIDYLPNYLKIIDKAAWKKSCLTVLTLTAVIFLVKNMGIAAGMNISPISSERGTMYTLKMYSEPIQQSLDYIKASVPKNSSVLVIPEGAMINFLSNRPSDDKYYSLIPNYIETLGEGKILNDLKKHPPDYIFINNRDCSDYGFSIFGQDFGFQINNFVQYNYKLVKSFGKNFSIQIYKKSS